MDSTITNQQWQRAISKVDRDMVNLGLFTKVVAEDVSVSFGGTINELLRAVLKADGFYIPWLNSIHLPNRWLTKHLPYRASGKPREIYCHEIGHALAGNHWGLVLGNARFREAFGNSYHGERKWAEAPDDYVTSYAMESPMEDFAETFASWVNSNGDSRGSASNRLKAKYAFIRSLPRRIQSLGIELA